jgi:hypothetical protein
VLSLELPVSVTGDRGLAKQSEGDYGMPHVFGSSPLDLPSPTGEEKMDESAHVFVSMVRAQGIRAPSRIFSIRYSEEGRGGFRDPKGYSFSQRSDKRV